MQKLTTEDFESIRMGNKIEGFEYEVIQDADDWEDQGKYQTSDLIFKHENKFYMFQLTRSGNHWSGYEIEYWDNDLYEVKQQEVRTVQWIAITQIN